MDLEEIKARKMEREKTPNTYAPRIAEFEYLLNLAEEQAEKIEQMEKELHLYKSRYPKPMLFDCPICDEKEIENGEDGLLEHFTVCEG